MTGIEIPQNAAFETVATPKEAVLENNLFSFPS
jgi:hypothetical protein